MSCILNVVWDIVGYCHILSYIAYNMDQDTPGLYSQNLPDFGLAMFEIELRLVLFLSG